MNKAQKYLLENNLDDIVLNEKEYPENNIFNSEKWIYLSDILEQYLAENKGQSLPIDSVSNCDAIFEQDANLTQEEIEEDCRNIPN